MDVGDIVWVYWVGAWYKGYISAMNWGKYEVFMYAFSRHTWVGPRHISTENKNEYNN